MREDVGMGDRGIRSRWARTVAVVGCAVLAAGCTTDQPEQSPMDRIHRETEVADDPDATAQEVIEAGSRSGVETDGEGRQLETYRATADGGEGPEVVAWRLLEPSGDEVASGILTRSTETTAGVDVVALDEGFAWVRWEQAPDTVVLLDEEGETTTVAVDQRRVPRAGDLLLAGWIQSPIVMRGRTPFHLSVNLDKSQRSTAWLEIDSDGSLWRVNLDSHLQRSRAGRPYENVLWPGRPSLPFASESIDVRDGVVAAVIVGRSRVLQALADVVVREPDGQWRSVGLEGARRHSVRGLEILPDGSLRLGDGPTYVLGPGQRRWRRIPPSDNEG